MLFQETIVTKIDGLHITSYNLSHPIFIIITFFFIILDVFVHSKENKGWDVFLKRKKKSKPNRTHVIANQPYTQHP